MKKYLLIIFVLIQNLGISQDVTSENFKTILSGVWTLNFCDSSWQIEEWICADTLTFKNNGQVDEVRTCSKPDGYPDEMDYDSILRFKEEWTRFDSKQMKLYYRTFNEWENSWSEETEHYRVISISPYEIKVECDAYSEGISKKETLRVLYKRLN